MVGVGEAMVRAGWGIGTCAVNSAWKVCFKRATSSATLSVTCFSAVVAAASWAASTYRVGAYRASSLRRMIPPLPCSLCGHVMRDTSRMCEAHQSFDVPP
jgi:hypothetical protein